MKYVIHTIGDYYDKIGGILVLHHLARKLVEKNQDVYLFCKNARCGANLIDESELYRLKDEAYMIYPEVIYGNPYNFSNVVRWVLHTPGYHGGDSDSWSSSDLVYLLSDYFKCKDGIVIEEEKLCVLDFKLDKFFNKNLSGVRSKNYHLFRKCKGISVFDKHGSDSICLDDIINNINTVDDVCDIFNEANMFISYDSATYYSIIAALCGATSVIVPDGINSKEEFVRKFPIFKYGVAYGVDDIEWANSTRCKLRGYLTNMEIENDKLIDKFIENTTKKFRKGI